MRPETAFDRFMKRWFLLIALLAVALWFPSTREAQSMCLRWLLGLQGNTFVQGQPPGCIIYEIPNVQFTPKYRTELRSRSTNSLDDFALATVTGNALELPWPPVESAWTNSPLFRWIVLQSTWRSVAAAGTNFIPQASFNSLKRLTDLALMADSSNGAFWQAKAAIDFAAHDNTAATSALWTASSRTNWAAGSADLFAHLSRLSEQAGLSELDAASQAEGEDSFAASLQGQNRVFIDNQMVQAVRQGRPEQFARLFRLLVELRRTDWTDTSAFVYNAYRRFSPSDELTAAMAVPLKINLATNWTSDYGRAKIIRQQIFQDFLGKYADSATVARFNSRAEAYETEHRLRSQIRENDIESALRWMFPCQIAGVLSLLTLSLLSAAIMFEFVLWHLRTRTEPPGKWPCEPLFWILSVVTVTGSSLILTKFQHAIGVGITVGFGPVEPPPIVNPLVLSFFCAFFVFSIGFLALLTEWKKGKLKAKPWKFPSLVAAAYLVSVVAMGFFRHQIVAEISARYQ
jgi:hypothetical protein